MSIYSHPDQKPLNKKWPGRMADFQKDPVNRRDDQGENIIWKACEAGQLKFVKRLIENNISLMTKRNDGATSFYIACQNGHHEVMELFKSQNVDINAVNDNGRTALYSCALNGNYRSAKWLIENGANVELGVKSANNDEILTPLIIASASGHVDIVQLLIDAGAEKKIYALSQAVLFNKPEVIRTLLKNGYDVNVILENGITLLMYASLCGHVESMQVLIDHEAIVNAVSDDGKNAFLAAVESGNFNAIALLSRNGAKIDVRSEGRNALHNACISGATIMVEHLLLMDFNPNEFSVEEDDQGLTPLMLASYTATLMSLIIIESPDRTLMQFL